MIAAREAAATGRYHVGGSDASGIVCAVGEEVTEVAVGDEVIVHHGWWDRDDPWVPAGRDPMSRPGEDLGLRDQSRLVRAVHRGAGAPVPAEGRCSSAWEEAAAPDAGRHDRLPDAVRLAGQHRRPGDVVLVWGGAGGLGTQAIQLVEHAGGLPVAVVSSPEKGEFCTSLGAVGYIDRREFDHWGMPPHWTDDAGQKAWTAGARRSASGSGTSSASGATPRSCSSIPARHDPDEHLRLRWRRHGRDLRRHDRLLGVVDLRYHWVRQKRYRGGTAPTTSRRAPGTARHDGVIDPFVGRVMTFEEIGQAHQMADGVHAHGNTAILVGAGARSR